MDKESNQEFQEPFCKVEVAESESYFAGICLIYRYQRTRWLFGSSDGDGYGVVVDDDGAAAVVAVIGVGCQSESRFSTKSVCDHMK